LDIDATPIAGIWFRHIPAGGDVNYQPAHPADNRWQRGDIIDALYLADSEQTAWAEWYRFLAEAALPPQQALPRDLWRWEISLPQVADLRGEDRLTRAGLPALQPTRRQWSLFQPVGEQLHRDGWPALVTCSAARPQGQTLCVFRNTPEVPGTRPIPPPTTVESPPVVPKGMRT
jgi:RES domain